ncbi:MAG TPA: hypothetical protein VM029_12380 [Opitutaceae bacterium]|nr:hypothetical protein [Opitutaceae bacterium]
MSYTYSIERAAAEVVLSVSTREQRFLLDSFGQIAAAPFQAADFEEIGMAGRRLLTRFFGPFSITYWRDDAAKEVRIALVYRD